MSYKFTKYEAKTVKLNKRSITYAVEFHEDHIRKQREEALFSQALSYAQNGNTKLYSLKDTTKELTGILGLIALSVSEVQIEKTKKPVALIDFLFVNNKYRSKTYHHLDDSKVSTLLIELAISKAMEASDILGISYLILYPEGGKDNVKLVEFYKSIGFDFLTNKHEWMYIKL